MLLRGMNLFSINENRDYIMLTSKIYPQHGRPKTNVSTRLLKEMGNLLHEEITVKEN